MMLRGFIYRVVMTLAHRFHWHYAPPIYPDGQKQEWCKWCGLRYVTYRQDIPFTGPFAELLKLAGTARAPQSEDTPK